MLNLDQFPNTSNLPNSRPTPQNLHLESALQDLSLYDYQVDAEQPGLVLAQLFELSPSAPGAVLMNQGEFLGMISQRRFLERLSRPYGREVFLKRSLHILYQFAQADLLILPGTILVVTAAERVIQRPISALSEPIVVQLSDHDYRLIDAQQVLIAQSCIHQLATELLRQHTQAQLIQSEKLATLGQLLAGVAHDIRNPVSCIAGNATCLTNYCKDLVGLTQVYETAHSEINDQVLEYKEEIEFDLLKQDLPEVLKSINVSVSRLNHLVESLRVFSRPDTLKRERTDIHECLDNTLLILQNRLKDRVKINRDYGKLPTLYCYPNQLSQVFMNLIINAVDALEETDKAQKKSGKIWIKTELRSSSLEEKESMNLILVEEMNSLMAAQSESYGDYSSDIAVDHQTQSVSREAELAKDYSCCISVQIRDNGPGIPSEIQHRIFENFFTTKSPSRGTGLGLSMSYQIIAEKHHGRINLKSKVGKGTEFEVLLPLLYN
ncbi:MAG: sensor histidine kinase [Microcoleaceae cyanobacterium]